MLGGAWNADGVILFGTTISPLMRISSAGGIPTAVTQKEASRGELYHTDPLFLSDGKHFLCFRHSSKPENQGVFTGFLDTQPEQQSLRRIQSVDSSPAYTPARDGESRGRLLFLQEATLVEQTFDERRLTTDGEPVPVAEQVGNIFSRAYFSVSRNGVLVYRGGAAAQSQFAWYDRAGHVVSPFGQAGSYRDVALSRDGSRIAYSRPTASRSWQICSLAALGSVGVRNQSDRLFHAGSLLRHSALTSGL